MHKGIYRDTKTNTWYIHTKKRGKNITIRGYQSKKEADEDYDFAVSRWLKEHDVCVNDNSYNSLVNEYLNYRGKLLRQESLRKDITQFKHFNPIFQNDTPKTIFDPLRLKLIYDEIFSHGDYSTNKKNELISTFREFAKYCYMTNRISKTTFDSVLLTFLPIKSNDEDVKVKRYIPISHFKALSKAIIDDNDYLFNQAIFVLYFGGLRISELLGLLKEDIDLDERKIFVRRQLLTNGAITTALKTKNSYRVIPISEELFSAMQVLGTKLNKRIFDYSHTTLKRKLAYYEEKANIPNYACHEFRHSFCTNLASKITNISEVAFCSKVAGHTTSMFLNTYVKSLDDEMTNKFFGRKN